VLLSRAPDQRPALFRATLRKPVTGYSFTDFAAGAACGTAAILAYAVRAPRSSLLAPSVYHGHTARAAIALTFDDGPSESTPELLDILAEYRAPATFFQCGANIRRLPEIARQVATAGHEIGNHSDTHPYLFFKSPGFIYRELTAAQETIHRVTGTIPRLFRAPFRTTASAARARPAGSHVDHDRPGLEAAGRPRCLEIVAGRPKRRHHVHARWTGDRHSPRHSLYAGSSTQSSAKIDRQRFPL